MEGRKPADKLKVIEGYQEPHTSTFDTSQEHVERIEVAPGEEASIKIVDGGTEKHRNYPWHRVLSYTRVNPVEK